MLAEVQGEPPNPDLLQRRCCGCVRKVSAETKGAVAMGGFTGRAGEGRQLLSL